MYGLIGRIETTPGDRDLLAEILISGVGGMPGCLSYVVARDRDDADALWVTEVWEDRESHAASLSLPGVREAIERGRPLIVAFTDRRETEPLGGHGLRPARPGSDETSAGHSDAT
jgi:quinol monooxygenase YgiN